MAVITISRGSYSHGKAIAEKIAQELGYECIARDILIEASREFNIPEIKLIHAVQDAPSILDHILYGKERYIAFIKFALLKHLQKDNVVYHGFAGHFFVKNISHVLKVRIIADMEDRVKLVMERDRIARKEAINFICKLDTARSKWSQHLYGIDTSNPSLYDLVLHIHKITTDGAVDLLINTIKSKHFQKTTESQQAMDDLVLAAEVSAILIDVKPDIEVSAKNGIVDVKTNVPLLREEELIGEMKKLGSTINGVKALRIHVLPSKSL
jgi:cytidylate kinase